MTSAPTNLIQALQATAQLHGENRGIEFYDTPTSSRFQSYAELDRRARRIGAALVAQGHGEGSTAVVVLQPGMIWAETVYGALFAGMAIVPTTAAGPGLADRIASLARASDASVIITERSVLDLMGSSADTLGIEIFAVEDLLEAGDAESWVDPHTPADSTAILMFTSGSTGEPKGVIGTQGGLLASALLCGEALDCTPNATFVGWLPTHHAMGIMLQIFMPASTGAHCVLTSTPQFQKRPMLWLQLISTHRATITAGGNFAFDLCTKLATDEQIAELDLSSLRSTISGSEPVRPETVQAFANRFAAAGLAANTVAPAMGMTEAMLISIKPLDVPFVIRRFDRDLLAAGTLTPSTDADAVELISSGHPIPSTTVAIVDPERLVLVDDGAVGELWISSPTVSPGYYNRPEATAEAFDFRLPGDDKIYMRSGDLASTIDGELFITGRLKDVIIIRGRNIHPQDIEAEASTVSPALGIAAAFEIAGARPGIGVVVEVDQDFLHPDVSLEALAALVEQAVIDRFSVPYVTVYLITVGNLPRTPTGKVRRKPTRLLLDRDGLTLLYPAGPLIGSAELV